jgi:hypothetical protein
MVIPLLVGVAVVVGAAVPVVVGCGVVPVVTGAAVVVVVGDPHAKVVAESLVLTLDDPVPLVPENTSTFA